MSKRDISLNRARYDIDTMNGEPFTIYDFPVCDGSRLRAALKKLANEEGEVIAFKNESSRLITYQAVKFPLLMVDITRKVDVAREPNVWAYSGWFPIPEFKVKSVYRHVGE